MFAFRLCLELGFSHPDHLLRSLTAKQFQEWQAFYTLDPFGDQRGDLRSGIVSAVIANAFRSKNTNPIEPSQFMPYLERHDQSPEEMQRTLQTILGQVIKDG